MPWGWILAQVIGNERSTKVAKIIVVHWRSTFLWRGQVYFPMHWYGHHTFVWEKCWEFQTTSSDKIWATLAQRLQRLWSLWANVAQILCGASLGWGNKRLLKWLRSIDQDGHHAHTLYMVKTFKNLLLRNRGCLWAESLHKSSGTRGLPKLLK